MKEILKNEPSGVLLVDKPAGMTSHDVVGIIRRLYNTKRVGHAGTLDPMATGLLVVLVGRAAKACEYISHDEKRYIAKLRLGLVTDTEDVTGTVLETSNKIPSSADVKNACAGFAGDIMQVPPMYSALKVGGRKLCDIARSGRVIEREARPVKIFDLSVTEDKLPSDYVLDVSCSGGTYIRTLCADIGNSLGCGGSMAALRRTHVGSPNGGFSVENAHTPEELMSMSEGELMGRLLPVESLFSDLKKIVPSEFYIKLSRSGCVIYQKKIGTALPLGTRVRLYDSTRENKFYAIGEVGDYPDDVAPKDDTTAIKIIKLFDL